MPIYSDLPIFEYYPRKELAIRELVEPLGINSLLDVGAGHGGVFDQRRFDFKRADPVAGGRDDVVRAAHKPDVAVFVALGGVAGVVPTMSK